MSITYWRDRSQTNVQRMKGGEKTWQGRTKGAMWEGVSGSALYSRFSGNLFKILKQEYVSIHIHAYMYMPIYTHTCMYILNTYYILYMEYI